MFKPRRLTILILLGLVSVFLLIIIVPYSSLNKNVMEGDLILDSDASFLAYKKYQQAENDWAILKVNIDFQRKFTKSKQAIENYKNTHPAVTIFLKDNASEPEVQNLVGEIRKAGGVINVKFISREEALRVYQERNKNNPELIKLITPNILPSSIEVYLRDWSLSSNISKLFTNKRFVQDAMIQRDWSQYEKIYNPPRGSSIE